MIDASVFVVIGIGIGIGIGVLVFAPTNVDDIFPLSAFFAHPHLTTGSVLVGQSAGIGVLVAASAVAASAAIAAPEGWIALPGLVPLMVGVRRLWLLCQGTGVNGDGPEASEMQNREHRAERRPHSQILAVMGATIANGGQGFCRGSAR